MIAFIESRHAMARALEGARREDPVRHASPVKHREPRSATAPPEPAPLHPRSGAMIPG